MTNIKLDLDKSFVLSQSHNPYPNNLNYFGFSGFLMLESLFQSKAESALHINKWFVIESGQEILYENMLTQRYTEIQESYLRFFNSVNLVVSHIEQVKSNKKFEKESIELSSFYSKALLQSLSYADLVYTTPQVSDH